MRDLNRTEDFCKTHDEYCTERYAKYDNDACIKCPLKSKSEATCDVKYTMLSRFEIDTPILQEWLNKKNDDVVH